MTDPAPSPFCFVLMPFGDKPDPAGGPKIPFDRIYEQGIKPAIEAAGLVAVRSDEERLSGIIHKAMFERLLLCEYAIADLTTANANVFYELGVRHTGRPRTTQAIFVRNRPLPFDVQILQAMPYDLAADGSFGDQQAAALVAALTARLRELRRQSLGSPTDSPLFQLLGDWQPGDLSRLKTDVFRDRTELGVRYRGRLAEARRAPKQEALARMQAIEAELGVLDLEEAGVIVDLMLSYRAVSAWAAMIDLVGRMPRELARQPMLREQFAFALNRRADKQVVSADRDLAIKVLEDLIKERGPTAETCGLLGRVHKDLWDLQRTNEPVLARGHLRNAIAAYVQGFEADLRDAYPGINAVTLLDIRGDADSLRQRDRLLPVVRFAVERRLASRTPDYWDHATMLELAVLGGDEHAAEEWLERALASLRESWEAGTTARNLGLIVQARRGRGVELPWVDAIVAALVRAEKGAGRTG